MEEDSTTTPTPQVILYKYRWVILTLVSLLNVTNQVNWLSYASIAFNSSSYYGVSLTWINAFSVIYLFLYIPCGILSSYALDTQGLKFSILLAAWGNLIGSWLKYVSCFFGSPHGRYAGAFIGQTFAGACQPLLLNCTTKLASNWFPPRQRATANMLVSVSPIVGVAIGSVIPPAIVSQDSDIAMLLLVLAILASVIGVIATIFMQDKPKHPPSILFSQDVLDPFFTGLKKVIKVKPYIILLLSFGTGVGIFNAIATILLQIIAPSGYNENDAGTFTAVMIAFGLLGAIITGPIVDKTHRYKEIYRTAYILACCSLLFWSLSIRPNMFALVFVGCSIVGLFSFSLIAVVFELAAEMTYPVAEGTSTGFLWMSGQVQAIFFIFIADAFTDLRHVCWLYFAAACVAAASSFFIKTKYFRREAEKQLADVTLDENKTVS